MGSQGKQAGQYTTSAESLYGRTLVIQPAVLTGLEDKTYGGIGIRDKHLKRGEAKASGERKRSGHGAKANGRMEVEVSSLTLH